MSIDLKEMESWLAEFVSGQQELWGIPGAAVAVLLDSEPYLTRYSGTASKTSGQPVTAQTLFPISSCTKGMTATALALLAEEGLLDWERPIRHTIPEFRMADPFASENMTALDLLCHRSGLPNHNFAWANSRFGYRDVLSRLPHIKPSQGFRSTWQYQNLVFTVAGCLIERLSGRPWETFMREELLSPLGMDQVRFGIEREGLPISETFLSAGHTAIAVPPLDIQSIAPAGSLLATLEDLEHWLKFNLDNDGSTLSQKGLEYLWEPRVIVPLQSAYPERSTQCVGLGWVVEHYRGERIIWHDGAINGCAFVGFIPAKGCGVAVLGNKTFDSRFCKAVAFQIFESFLGDGSIHWPEILLKEASQEAKDQAEGLRGIQVDHERHKRPKTSPSHDLEEYTGVYEDMGYGEIRIEKKDGGLRVDLNGLGFTLSHYHYDVFELRSEVLPFLGLGTFQTDVFGNISGVLLPLEPKAAPIEFRKKTKGNG